MVMSAKTRNSIHKVDMPGTLRPKKKKFRFKVSGPSLILLFVLGFIFYAFAGQMVEVSNVEAEIKDIQVQMQELQEKNADLRGQIEQLSSEPFIEREAREKLGLVRPGEKIILEAKPGPKGDEIPSVPQNLQKIEVH